MQHLRRKLGTELIETVRGVGYLLRGETRLRDTPRRRCARDRNRPPECPGSFSAGEIEAGLTCVKFPRRQRFTFNQVARESRPEQCRQKGGSRMTWSRPHAGEVALVACANGKHTPSPQQRVAPDARPDTLDEASRVVKPDRQKLVPVR